MITKQHVRDLCKAAEIAGFVVDPRRLNLVVWNAGDLHIPTALEPQMAAIYIFKAADECLKVGKANSKTKARYQSQHYSPDSCKSNLAKSLLGDADFEQKIERREVGSWIRTNTSRYNILIPADIGKDFIHFAEAFFRLLCRPRFEGG